MSILVYVYIRGGSPVEILELGGRYTENVAHSIPHKSLLAIFENPPGGGTVGV